MHRLRDKPNRPHSGSQDQRPGLSAANMRELEPSAAQIPRGPDWSLIEQHDRQVAGNAKTPKIALAALIARQHGLDCARRADW